MNDIDSTLGFIFELAVFLTGIIVIVALCSLVAVR